jgi:hypothetical protein
MAVDNRPFKSKEQDGQGNEVIIRDQQLVEQGTTTTMPAGACFQTLDVDGRPVKIPKDNMLNLIVEGLGIIFNGQSDQQTVTKVPTLNGNNFGASTVATLASVLGALSQKADISGSDSNFDSLYGENSIRSTTGYSGSTFGSMSYGVIVTITGKNGYGQQIFFNDHENKIYTRDNIVASGSSWGTWKTIYDTDLLSNSAMLGQLANALGVGTISGETTTLNFQLIPAARNTAGIIVAYDMDDITKYCSAVIYIGSDTDNFILITISKSEINGMTINGGYWGYVTFGGITEGHRIKYMYRKLV